MNKIEITNNAQDHIASILAKDSANYFRITVLGGGCAGFQYKFDFENLKNDDDILIEEEKINQHLPTIIHVNRRNEIIDIG